MPPRTPSRLARGIAAMGTLAAAFAGSLGISTQAAQTAGVTTQPAAAANATARAQNQGEQKQAPAAPATAQQGQVARFTPYVPNDILRRDNRFREPIWTGRPRGSGRTAFQHAVGMYVGGTRIARVHTLNSRKLPGNVRERIRLAQRKLAKAQAAGARA